MSLSKQAKTLSKHQQTTVLSFLQGTRHPERNRLIFLLSVRAGLRAKEIANIRWRMVMDSEGTISDSINLHNEASKGNSGGIIWLNKELKQALETYLKPDDQPDDFIIRTRTRKSTSPQVIVNMFYDGTGGQNRRLEVYLRTAMKSNGAELAKDVVDFVDSKGLDVETYHCTHGFTNQDFDFQTVRDLAGM